MRLRRIATQITVAAALICTLAACGSPPKPAKVAAPAKDKALLSPLQARHWELDGKKRCQPIGTLAELLDEQGCFARDKRRGSGLELPDGLQQCGVVDALLAGDQAVTDKTLALARDAITLTDSSEQDRPFEIDCGPLGGNVDEIEIVKQSIAFLALAGNQQDVPRLIALLKEPRLQKLAKSNPGFTNSIARAVLNLGDGEAVDDLVGVLMTNLDMERKAVRVATARRRGALVDACYEAWNASELGHRSACREYLLRVDAPADVPRLVRHLKESRSPSAARLLGRTGDPGHAPLLEAAMAKVRVADRAPFLVALVNLGQQQYWNELARILEPRRRGRLMYPRRERALNEITLLRDPCQLERVKASLRKVPPAPEGYPSLYHANSQAMLAALGEPASMETVIELLRSRVPAVRYSVLEHIRGYRSPPQFEHRGATSLVDERLLPALLKLRKRERKPHRRRDIFQSLFSLSGELRHPPQPVSTPQCPAESSSLFDPTPSPGGRKLYARRDDFRDYEIKLPAKPVFRKSPIPFFKSLSLKSFKNVRWTTGKRDPVVRYQSKRCRSQPSCFFTVITSDFVYVNGSEQAELKRLTRALVEVTGGRLVESKAIEIEARPGREGVIQARQSGREAMVRFRLYFALGSLYMLISVEDWSNDKGELVSYVFDSFQLLPK